MRLVHDSVQVNWRLLAAIMTRFHELDVERNGIVTKAQFLGGFSDEQQQRAKRLFSIMDTVSPQYTADLAPQRITYPLRMACCHSTTEISWISGM